MLHASVTEAGSATHGYKGAQNVSCMMQVVSMLSHKCWRPISQPLCGAQEFGITLSAVMNCTRMGM